MLILGREKSENTTVSGGECTCRTLMLQSKSENTIRARGGKSENATVSGGKPELRTSAVGSKTAVKVTV